MAENVEEIEAKLAAYVDGELTPAERVEIETYLQTNPSHRALLQDLVNHRNLLRRLPREKAPGDCTEGFQGQLERDILLGGNELTVARRRWRIHYSPQLLSAAAIILVAVALGIIVYAVLPPHQPHAPIAQLSTEPTRSAEPVAESTTALADTRASKATGDVLAKKGATTTENWAMLHQETVGQKAAGSFGANAGRADQQQQIAAGDMMVITVTADDVKSANDAVVSYLALNKIDYTAQAHTLWNDSLEAVAAGRRMAASSGLPGGAGGGGFAGGVALDATAAQLPALRANEDQVAKRAEEKLDRSRADVLSERQEKAVAAQQEPREQTQLSVAQGQERFAQDASAARPAKLAPQPTRAPSTQPTAVAGTDPRGGNDMIHAKVATGATLGGVASDALLLKQQSQQQLRAYNVDQDSAACVILARDMNGQQVRELARSLSQPERNLYATVQMDRSDAYQRGALATLARLKESDVKDQLLVTRQQQLEQFNENELAQQKVVAANAPAAVGPATRPAEQVTLNIKPADAGISRDESRAGVINGTIADNADKAQYGAVVLDRPQQLPGEQQAAYFATTPATQPARLDVYTCVIVVQNNPAARAGGAATSQPVAGKPATTAPANPPSAPAKDAK